MSKRKLLTLAMTVAMIAILAIGGTLAYFTDEDSATNTMTLGGVNIIQNEEQRDENGEMEPFKQDKPMMPMVDNRTENDPIVDNGYFNAKMENVVDKIVTVTNEAPEGAINQDAYVRTILAFETNVEYEEGTDTERRDAVEIFNTYIGVLGSKVTYTDIVVEIDGVKYLIAYRVYTDALVPGEKSEPSLKQIFMSPDADNEIQKLFGTEYTVLALSQGTQTTGFGSAEEALNEAFGEINAANVTEWLSAMN